MSFKDYTSSEKIKHENGFIYVKGYQYWTARKSLPETKSDWGYFNNQLIDCGQINLIEYSNNEKIIDAMI